MNTSPQDPRAPYESPRIEVLGQLTKLTQSKTHTNLDLHNGTNENYS